MASRMPPSGRDEAVLDRIPLGSVGETQLFLAYTRTPWMLPVEAFTVPAGTGSRIEGGFMPTLSGGLAVELRKQLGDSWFSGFEKLVGEAVARTGFGPVTPILVALPSTLASATGVPFVFVATASGPNASVDHAGEAASAIARLASSRKISRVAISLLGSGASGLDSRSVARSMVLGVAAAGPLPGVREVTFSTLAREVIDDSGELTKIVETHRTKQPAAAPARRSRRSPTSTDGPALTLTPGDMDPHVRQALLAARSLAEPSAIGAAHVLRAVVSARTSPSEAFDRLRTLITLPREPIPGLNREDDTIASPPEGDTFRFSPELHVQLEHALWPSTPPRRRRRKLWGRDLVAAALLARGDDVPLLLKAHGVDLGALRDAWYVYVTREGSGGRPRGEWNAWWTFAGVPIPPERMDAEVTPETLPMPPVTTTPPPQDARGEQPAVRNVPEIPVASTGSDDPWASGLDDRLHVGDEAKALARLAASRRFQPPLAVGVFGDWGSGKSFFMRLMYEHTARLARGSSTPEAPEASDPTFHRGIVQVRFNAWHYVETNLWASLVDHLFTELDRWLREHQEDGSRGSDALLEKLSTARELTLEAAEQLVRRRKEQREAAERLARAERALAQARASAGSSTGVYWAAVHAALTPEPGEPANAVNRRDELAASAASFRAAAKRLGFDEVEQNAEALEAATGALVGEVERARLLRRGLLDPLARGWVYPLAVACLVAPTLAVILARRVLDALALGASDIHAFLLGASAVLASVTAGVGAAARSARSAVDLLARSKAALDAAVAAKLRDPGAKVATGHAALAKVTAEAEEARALLAATTERLAQATREYASGTGNARLLSFIRARATDGHYARHLGLMAAVRRDFAELASRLDEASSQTKEDVAKAREAFARRVSAVIAEHATYLSDEEKATLQQSTEPPPPVTTFQRIVLYVDDLDRCPPEKVVEVLQAVHLLLTFPLFVVVVAVDVRWVSRALERHYPNLLEPAGSAAGRLGGATAHDYLEKIFQVPYWVRPMDAQACRDFLADRAGKVNAAATGGHPPSSLEAGTPPATEKDGEPRDPGPERPSERAPTLVDGTPAGASGDPPPPAPGVEVPASPEPPAKAVEGPRLDARALSLDDAEKGFMGQLAPHLGRSPRRALRFLNVYCVIKASLTRSELDELEGGFPALMTQLAIATGAPTLLDDWLTTLSARPIASLAELRELLSRESWYRLSPDHRRLEGALEVYGRASDGADAVARLLKYGNTARRYSFTG